VRKRHSEAARMAHGWPTESRLQRAVVLVPLTAKGPGVARQIVDCEKLAEGRRFLKDQLAGQPVSHWAKLFMALQSIVSFVVVGSVTARAVSVRS